MFKKCLLFTSVAFVGGLHAQVGINILDPKSTLHIAARKTDGTTAEGIIAPNLTRSQLISKDGRYGMDQEGAIVYITTIDGTTTAKTTNVTASGYYYFDGSIWEAFRTAVVVVPTEPWQVQGGTNAATTNTQNIYQTGSVAIGSNSAGTYKFQVTGTRNITGNSRTTSSTVVGNETVGGTLGVTGTSTLTGNVGVGAAPSGTYKFQVAGDSDITNNSVVASSSVVGNETVGGTLGVTGTSTLTGNVGVGAAPSGTYKFQVTGTRNVTGNSRTASSTVIGNETVGGTLGVTGATTLNNNLTVGGTSALQATNITGTLNYKPGGTAPAANAYLRTDATGNASWQALPITATTEPWQVQGGTTLATTNAQNIYQTGSVHVGANTAVTAYKFQVTGASNVTGNSRVATSSVVGNKTVGGTLNVTSTSALTGNVGIGGASNATYNLYVTGTDYTSSHSYIAGSIGLGTITLSQKLNVAGNTYISGSLGLGIASPVQKLHVVGNEYLTGIAKFGGNTTYNSSAQLELSDNNKGFLPNRVALTSPTVKAPVTNAVAGMLVYNTATRANLIPGFYIWDGTSWQAFVTRIPDNVVTGYDLLTTVVSVATTPAASQGGALMSFGDVGTTTKHFTIKEEGSYTFGIRVYGAGFPASGKTMGRSSVYFTLMINGVKKDVQEVDWALVDPNVITAQNRFGGTIALTGNGLKVGDKVEFRVAHDPAAWSQAVHITGNPGLIANKTSLVFWKL